MDFDSRENHSGSDLIFQGHAASVQLIHFVLLCKDLAFQLLQ